MATLISFKEIREFCESVGTIISRIYLYDFETHTECGILATCAGVNELIDFLRENNLYTIYGESKGHVIDMFTEDEEIFRVLTA